MIFLGFGLYQGWRISNLAEFVPIKSLVHINLYFVLKLYISLVHIKNIDSQCSHVPNFSLPALPCAQPKCEVLSHKNMRTSVLNHSQKKSVTAPHLSPLRQKLVEMSNNCEIPDCRQNVLRVSISPALSTEFSVHKIHYTFVKVKK